MENYSSYSAKNIFNKASDMIKSVFKIKDVIKESQEQNKYNWQLYIDTDNLMVDDDYTL